MPKQHSTSSFVVRVTGAKWQVCVRVSTGPHMQASLLPIAEGKAKGWADGLWQARCWLYREWIALGPEDQKQ